LPRREIKSKELKHLASMDMGMRIRYLREQMGQLYLKGFSVTGLSKKLEVTHQSLTSIERGDTTNPSFKVIYRLSKAFNVSIEVFTDEYYSVPLKPFYIGYDDADNDERTPTIEREEIVEDDKEESIFKYGCIHYQIFDNKEIQILCHAESSKNIDQASMIQLISRNQFEFELLNTRNELNSPQYLKENINTFNKTLNNYFSVTKNTDLYPRATIDNIDIAIKKLLTKQSNREE
jgi:transcriptional regulator with XRE-family HTH domain